MFVRSQAFRLGMFGAEYAWLVSGMPPRIRGAPPCSRPQLARALEGLVTVTAHRGIVGDAASFSGLVSGVKRFIFVILVVSVLSSDAWLNTIHCGALETSKKGRYAALEEVRCYFIKCILFSQVYQTIVLWYSDKDHCTLSHFNSRHNIRSHTILIKTLQITKRE